MIIASSSLFRRKTPRVPGSIPKVSRRSSQSTVVGCSSCKALHALQNSRAALQRAGFAYPNRPSGPAWVSSGLPARSQGPNLLE